MNAAGELAGHSETAPGTDADQQAGRDGRICVRSGVLRLLTVLHGTSKEAGRYAAADLMASAMNSG